MLLATLPNNTSPIFSSRCLSISTAEKTLTQDAPYSQRISVEASNLGINFKMSSIVQALGDLVSSIAGVFMSVVNTAFSALQSIFVIFTNLLGDVLHLFEGLFEFLLGK